MTITPELLAELKRLDAVATKGEWKSEYDPVSQDHYLKVELPCINGLSAWFQLGKVRSPDYAEVQMTDGAFSHGENNASFITAARNHLREVIDGYEALERENERLTDFADKYKFEAGDHLVTIDALRRTVAEKDATISRLLAEKAKLEKNLSDVVGSIQ